MGIFILIIAALCGLLIGLLAKIYFFKNWQLVYATTAEWIIDTDFGEIKKKCWYEIYWSEKDDEFMLKTGGYSPKQHKKYELVVEKLNSLRQSATKSYNK